MSEYKLYQGDCLEVMGSISSVVKDRLRKEGLTVTHKRELRHNLSISYDLIEW